MNRRRLISLLRSAASVALIVSICAATAYADSWTCPICRQTFYFDPRDQAHKSYWTQMHLNAHGSPSSANSEVVQSLSAPLQQLFNSMGRALAEAIFGNPAEKARLAELRRLEEVRLAEEARSREIERRRRQIELHSRLLSELKLIDTDLALMRVSDQTHLEPMSLDNKSKDKKDSGKQLDPIGIGAKEDDGLRPGGTPFFGLGGGDLKQGPEDKGVVDLRDLRRAAYLVQAANNSPADADFLTDEALRVSSGQPPFVAIDDNAVPVISEQGLLAFQKANNEYRLARDTHLKASQSVVNAERNLQIWSEGVRRLKAELEDAESRKMDASPQHRLLAELLGAEKRLLREGLSARVESDKAQSSVAWTNNIRRLTLRSLVVPEPLPLDVLHREREESQPSTLEQFVHRSPMLEGARQFLSQQVDDRLAQSHGFVQDAATQRRLDNIVDRLRAASIYPNEGVQVRILDLPKDPSDKRGLENNVIAIGDTIYVGKKFLDGRPSDDELAFVFGHELGHVHRDHAARQLMPMLAEAVQIKLQNSGDIDTSKLASEDKERLRSQIFAARIADYKRALEFEADRYGALLALSGGVKPGAVRDVFQRIQAMESTGMQGRDAASQKLLDLTRDHATPSDRYEQLRRAWGTRVLPELTDR